MVGKDVVGHFAQPDVAFHHLFGVDILHIDIDLIAAFFALVSTDIFHGKAQNVFIPDGVDNHVFMQAFIEQQFGSLFDTIGDIDVIGKDWRPGKTKQLCVLEEVHDRFMRVTELAAVAFIEDKDDALFAQVCELSFIPFMSDSVIQFLNSSQRQFGAALLEMFYQRTGVVGGIHAVFRKTVELFRRLIIQIPAINHKNDPIHFRHFHDHLAGFERGQRFTGASGVPDITVLRTSLFVEILLHMADHRLTGIKLVRAHHHQALTGFIQHRVVGDHFGDVTDFQKCVGEFLQRFERVILFIGPEEGLLEVVGAVVGVIFGVHAVADNKDLHILEQAAAYPEGIPMVTIDLVKGLFQPQAATLKFDLHQRQAVDQ